MFEKLSIEVKGNDKYGVIIKSGDRTIIDGYSRGDFNVSIRQSDRHNTNVFDNILFDKYEVVGNKTVLTKKFDVPDFIMFLEIKVTYEILKTNIIKKEVTLLQRNVPQVYYKIDNIMYAPEKVDKYWTFDEFIANENTDMNMQRFPAIGYKIHGLHVGLVSESGYVNKYVRNKRKRKITPNFSYDAFEPIQTYADSEFMDISHNDNDYYIKMTIGEFVDTKGNKEFYNYMPLGKEEKKTFYIFASEINDIRGLKLASQECFSDGRGFIGTIPEKVLYADSRINIVCAEVNDFSPHSVPAPIGYAPDMYNRDTFWAITATRDKDLNEKLCERFWDTQNEIGCIGTIITPVTGSVEVKDNDSTILMFLWALLNKRRFGSQNIPMEKIKKAYEYSMNALDPNLCGSCVAHFALSQQDISYYENGEQLSVNQGMYAVFLRAAMEFGFPVEESYILKVEQKYRDYYDEKDKTIRLTQDDTMTTSFDNLIPEFLSLWLFDHKMLTDEMVIGMIESYPDSSIKDAKGLFVKRDGNPLTLNEWPFKKNEYNQPGLYYNNGSWLRGEVMAYATSFKHGYKKGSSLITKRLQAELDRYYDDPVSHEFLPTDANYAYDDWIRNNSVFSWNVFALIAEEMAGIRSENDDVDINK